MGGDEMGQSTVFVVLTILALGADIVPAAAQSPYTYPWCLQGAKSGNLSCYFNNYQECMTTARPLGAYALQRLDLYLGPFHPISREGWQPGVASS
jgi:hypothetical protein